MRDKKLDIAWNKEKRFTLLAHEKFKEPILNSSECEIYYASRSAKNTFRQGDSEI